MFRPILAVGAVMLAFVPGLSPAAPQIMGLVATAEPTPMQCSGGQCTALLSAFCLQEKRLPPDYDGAYRPARPGQVFLVATMADGSIFRFETDGLTEFRTRYGYTAVEVSLPLDRLEGEKPVSLTLEVAPRASLLPVMKAGDPDPLTAHEIATATGPWRLAAVNSMEGTSEGAVAARTVMQLVNALPVAGDIRPAEREALWENAVGDLPLMARQPFDACVRSVDQSVGYTLRKCLEERHQELQVENTREFWRTLGGS